jgi:DNA-nicking Smr family endonuclease
MKSLTTRPPSCGSFAQLSHLLQTARVSLKNLGKSASKPAPPRILPVEESDEDAFRRAMEGVKRRCWSLQTTALPSTPIMPRSNTQSEESRLMQDAMKGKYALEASDHPEYIEAWVCVAGKRFLPKLRCGLYSIQGQIDLHGLNQNEARQEVEQFIVKMACVRSCCVKIIHGRGMNSRQNRAILKEKLQRWLSTRRMSRYVVAYASAPLNDGGVGAVYILLKHQ